MPEMTAPNGQTREVPAAGVEALRALGWTGADTPEDEPKSSPRRARAPKGSKED